MSKRKTELTRAVRRLDALRRMNRLEAMNPAEPPAVTSPLLDLAPWQDPERDGNEAMGALLSLAGQAFAESVWAKFQPAVLQPAEPRLLETADLPSVLGRTLLSRGEVKP